MKQVLQRLDQLERKIESEVGGLRADVLSRLAELEMRVTTALLDAVRYNQQLLAELRRIGWRETNASSRSSSA
jgi:hypothetical protein